MPSEPAAKSAANAADRFFHKAEGADAG